MVSFSFHNFAPVICCSVLLFVGAYSFSLFGFNSINSCGSPCAHGQTHKMNWQ